MPQKPPVLVYRRSRPQETYEEEEAREPQPIKQAKGAVNLVFKITTAIILVAILLVWLVVGVVFWLPWILRASFLFVLSLMESTFQGTKPKDAAKVLRDAVSFYKRGFEVAIEMVTREELDELDDEDDAARPEGGRLLREMVWAALVWYFILLWIGTIQFSPLDLWEWLRSIQWGELAGALPRLPGRGGT
jgi:hypothetical protein